jgi:hypothetical protein
MCWNHENLPLLLQALGCTQRALEPEATRTLISERKGEVRDTRTHD